MKIGQNLAGAGAAIGVGALVAWAGSTHSTVVGGVPLFAALALLAYLVQWLAFIPSYVFQTERFFDLTGSLTYLTVVAAGLALNPLTDARGLLVGRSRNCS